MKQDDIIIVEILDYGMEGEGIARADGCTIFIPFAIKGEKIKAKVNYVKKKTLVFATLLEVITPSEDRQESPCNRYGKCGGCDLLHLNYAKQIEVKRQGLVNVLRKNAHCEFPVDEMVPSDKIYAYRNKIQIPFGTVNGKVAMGFFRNNTHKIVSITKCFLHGEWAEKLIGIFLEYANGNRLTVYDEETQKGLLRHLVARYIDDKICIVVVVNGKELPNVEVLKGKLNAYYGDNYSLYISTKTEPDNVVMGKTARAIVANPFVIDILGIKLSINPYSFLQLNDYIRDKIYNRIIKDIMSYEGEKTVIDAYAGVGIIGAVIAKRGAKVYNIEIVPEAIADADRLAEANGITDRVTNLCGDAAELLPKLLKEKKENLFIIIDPPRKGCDKTVIDALNAIEKPHRLYYVSCNPATLSRDLATLTSYSVTSITPYDMFPNTKHLETLVCLTRKQEK